MQARANGWSDRRIDSVSVADLREIVDAWARTGRAVPLEDYRQC